MQLLGQSKASRVCYPATSGILQDALGVVGNLGLGKHFLSFSVILGAGS